jgi:sialate O-acetylesterase
MQMTVMSSNQSKEEIAAANYPQIRLVSVPTVGTQVPQSDFKGHWAACSPQTVPGFSAAAYFFGRELYRNLNVPIGLIHCSWGGSSCEAWVKRSLLEADPQYHGMLDQWEHTVATYDPEKAKADFQRQVTKWKNAVAAAKAAGKDAPKPPRFAGDPRTGQHRPANCYNGMLLPVMPFAIRGVIWYQGESNAGQAYQYRSLFPLMIKNWREDWQQGDFSFYFVQLANYMAVKPQPTESAWAELREAQTMTLKVPHTGQAVIIDIGDATNIHPTNKQDVGKRLALWALAKDYGKKLVYSSPMYKSVTCQGNQVVIHFDSVGGGLVAKDGPELKGFTIAGADKKFVLAQAEIVGDTVVVSSPNVRQPVAVRYAWADNPICNLYSQAGLPVCPFRTDTWPGITCHKQK